MLNTNDLSIPSQNANKFFVRVGHLVRIAFGESYDKDTTNYHNAISLDKDDARELINVLQRLLDAENQPAAPINRKERRAAKKT